MKNVAINGFGRIGQAVVRIWAQHEDKKFALALINGGDVQRIYSSLKYDSVYGVFPGTVEKGEDCVYVNGEKIEVRNQRDEANLPWKENDIDIVIDSTGRYRTRETAQIHLDQGAKKILITAPAKGDDITIVMGVNEDDYDHKNHHIISNASCTTNCLAPVAKILDREFGIEMGMMTTIHAYTNDQVLVDSKHSDPRRARAAALNMIPTTTGAAQAVSLVLPQLKGKFSGMSMRVPTPTVSVVDLVVTTKKPVTIEAVNEALKIASQGEMKGILGYSEEPLVSTDYKGDKRSSIVDALSTDVLGEKMVKVIAWYDNEWGYAERVVDLCDYMVEKSK
ncbi:MAG: type I glyceraldehyde-3-phosphate dehydrogenase [Tissierellia bacterium]|nr:type I glyceraldehyde-3-phosphate dehydrogenase [Tissierellia bacterium]